MRIARHSSSDLVLLASDIFRTIANLDRVGADGSMGREIDWCEERAARINISDVSDVNVSVMCTMYSQVTGHYSNLLSTPREWERIELSIEFDALHADKTICRHTVSLAQP